jgi:hypothetical protein
MPIIYSYQPISNLSGLDTILVNDTSEDNTTKTASIDDIKDYIGLGTDVLKKDITITPAQLLSFNGGGSIELIPAPGAGKLIAVQNMIYFLDYNSASYNFATPGLSDTITFKIGTVNTFQNLSATNDLNVSADKYISFDFPNNDENDDIQANVAFTLDATSGVTVSQGNSTIKLSILYRNVNLNF